MVGKPRSRLREKQFQGLFLLRHHQMMHQMLPLMALSTPGMRLAVRIARFYLHQFDCLVIVWTSNNIMVGCLYICCDDSREGNHRLKLDYRIYSIFLIHQISSNSPVGCVSVSVAHEFWTLDKVGRVDGRYYPPHLSLRAERATFTALGSR